MAERGKNTSSQDSQKKNANVTHTHIKKHLPLNTS